MKNALTPKERVQGMDQGRTVDGIDVVQKELVGMNECEVEIERPQQDLFGGHDLIS